MRLNRYLAQCGLGSRRAVEQLILEGKVTINGKVVRDLASQVESAATVVVEGKIVRPARRFEYIMLNKPNGYDVTRGGSHHHRRAWDLLPEGTHSSVQSVGRLDRDSTGLLIFTNDGDLAFRLAHPRYGCTKTYVADVEGNMPPEKFNQLTAGLELEDGPAKPVRTGRQPAPEKDRSRLVIVMAEGRNRIVRRMCEALGYPVINLNRIALGQLELGDLARGKTRPLSKREITMLRRSVGLSDPFAEEEGVATQHKPVHGRPARPGQGRSSRPGQGRSGRPAQGRSSRSTDDRRGAKPEHERSERPMHGRASAKPTRERGASAEYEYDRSGKPSRGRTTKPSRERPPKSYERAPKPYEHGSNPPDERRSKPPSDRGPKPYERAPKSYERDRGPAPDRAAKPFSGRPSRPGSGRPSSRPSSRPAGHASGGTVPDRPANPAYGRPSPSKAPARANGPQGRPQAKKAVRRSH